MQNQMTGIHGSNLSRDVSSKMSMREKGVLISLKRP
jgi:hypothetical protein